MHKCFIWRRSDDSQTVPPSNKESHSLKPLEPRYAGMCMFSTKKLRHWCMQFETRACMVLFLYQIHQDTIQDLRLILLEGNLPKSGNPYCGPTNDRRPTTNWLTAEELKYSRHSAQGHLCPTNNMFEVWQNSAPFGGRPIGAAVEALLTKFVNWWSSVLLIVVFLKLLLIS